ncbi:MAG: 16S rRNA (cytidine(1402)-2'-O)-methyltransferase [Actinobacteria bacterium]|nr:16S rRNA (cytidine(1402)-2'-O)-methyltransferase [Actinomycetota bacterium]
MAEGDAGPGAAAGRLVLVGTPIGNLGDLSPRAAAALAAADVVAAEDTRRSRVLLGHAGVRTPLVSYHEHNEERRTGELVERIAAGDTVALVTDAGTPGISDPGYRLVRATAERGLSVEAVPGPVAAVQALVVSGLPTDRFAFEGFLPRRAGPRRRRLGELAADPRTLVFYVAPHRAGDDLAAMAEVFGDRDAALARELTKRHEDVWRAPLPALAERAAAEPPRGEVTVVVAGSPGGAPTELTSAALAARVAEQVAAGVSRRDAVTRVAESTGAPRRRVYQAAVDHHD